MLNFEGQSGARTYVVSTRFRKLPAKSGVKAEPGLEEEKGQRAALHAQSCFDFTQRVTGVFQRRPGVVGSVSVKSVSLSIGGKNMARKSQEA